MDKIEKRRARAREATRRYRAKKAAGGTIRHAIPAPSGVELRDIPGFSNYRADDRGNIYSRLPVAGAPKFEDGPHVPWRVLVPFPNPSGRWTVRARADGEKKRKRTTVHRLIALAFLGPRSKGMQVAHGPNGWLDNSVGNLSYKTPAQNKADELRDGTRYRGERHHANKLNAGKWRELQERLSAGERKSDLCREFGISETALHRRLKLITYSADSAGIFDGVLHGGGSGIRHPCVT